MLVCGADSWPVLRRPAGRSAGHGVGGSVAWYMDILGLWRLFGSLLGLLLLLLLGLTLAELDLSEERHGGEMWFVVQKSYEQEMA